MRTPVMSRNEITLFSVIALAMAATRVHHFGIGEVLPDASVAVFFLAGLWVRNPIALGALLLEAFLLDAAAIGWANVPATCVTPGYLMLIPAYAALWFAGRQVAQAPVQEIAGGARIAAALLAGVAVFFAISNLGFYIGGGFAASHGPAAFTASVIGYFPMFLGAAAAYAAIALAIRALVAVPQTAEA
jgi:hypothetical protein